MSKVFAIIVTFNGKPWIEKCLHSLQASSVPVEIIVIDNGSTDSTQESIAKFNNIDFIQSKQNLGFGQANNVGLKKAYSENCDYAFLLNQDAWVDKDTIEKLVALQMMEPGFGIVSPMHLNGTGSSLDPIFCHWLSHTNCPGFIADSFLNRLSPKLYEIKFVNAAAWLLSRQCIETVGGFNPLFFQYGEDDNYIHRAHFHGFKIGLASHAHIHHDRAERDANVFFDIHQYQKRLKLLNYCDPSKRADFIFELKNFRKKIGKHALKFEFQSIRTTSQEIKDLKSLTKLVNDIRKKSKEKGPTFL